MGELIARLASLPPGRVRPLNRNTLDLRLVNMKVTTGLRYWPERTIDRELHAAICEARQQRNILLRTVALTRATCDAPHVLIDGEPVKPWLRRAVQFMRTAKHRDKLDWLRISSHEGVNHERR
jgi:hypothetical protein